MNKNGPQLARETTNDRRRNGIKHIVRQNDVIRQSSAWIDEEWIYTSVTHSVKSDPIGYQWSR